MSYEKIRNEVMHIHLFAYAGEYRELNLEVKYSEPYLYFTRENM